MNHLTEDLLDETILLKEISSFYVNKIKLKQWSNKIKTDLKEYSNSIKIQSKTVTPHLNNLQTKSLLDLLVILYKKDFDNAFKIINNLDTASREVFFNTMNEE